MPDDTYVDSDGSKLRVGKDQQGNIRYSNSKGQRHRLDGPACEYADGTKEWRVEGKEAEPLFLVAYWLERGRCCWYDETTNELRFG